MTTTRDQFREVVREQSVDLVTALLLIAAEAGCDPDPAPVLAELDRLAALARSAGGRPHLAIGQALQGFSGAEADFDRPAASLLPEVLRRRSGLPILLSVVWVEVARRLGVAAHCVGLPGRVLVSVDGVVVDPFEGGVPVELPDVPVLDGGPLLLRVLTNLKLLGLRTGDTALSLWAVELALLLPAHPLSLRQERGKLLVRRGAFEAGARELEAFAALAPPPEDDEARRAATMARAQLN